MSEPKQVIKIPEVELPEPFASYWRSDERLERSYEFYLVGDQLYILDSWSEYLMHHWTLDGCAGISCFMTRQGIREDRTKPYVGTDGQYMFEVVQSDNWETSIRDLNGKLHCVHSG